VKTLTKDILYSLYHAILIVSLLAIGFEAGSRYERRNIPTVYSSGDGKCKIIWPDEPLKVETVTSATTIDAESKLRADAAKELARGKAKKK